MSRIKSQSGPHSLEHIGRSIWGMRYSRENLFAMLSAYFDEAYGSGFTVVCGWIASIEQWIHFQADWVCLLGSYKIPYFHMKEFSQSKGHFAKWKEAENFRARFLHDVHDIIRSRVRRGFVCGIQDVLFERVNRSYCLKESFPSCYAFAGREAMDWANRVAVSAGDEVKCIFEDGGPDKGGLLSAADVAPMIPSPDFEPSRDVQDRKKGKRRGVIQLQAADFLAYEVRKFWVDYALYRTGQRQPRESMRKFGGKRPDTKLMSEQRILATCQRYGIKARTSPVTASPS